MPGRGLGLRLAQCVAFVLATAAVIAPWSVRNYFAYGQFVLISSGFGETLWKANNEVSDGGPDDRFIYLDNPIWKARVAALPDTERMAVEAKYDVIRERLRERRRELHDVFLARDEVLGPVAKEHIRAEPLGFARKFARSVAALFSAYSDTDTKNAHTGSLQKVARGTQFYPLLALAIFGAGIGLPAWRRLLPLYLLVGAWIAAHGTLTACTRFRLDIDPVLIVFSAIGVSAILSYASERLPRPDAQSASPTSAPLATRG